MTIGKYMYEYVPVNLKVVFLKNYVKWIKLNAGTENTEYSKEELDALLERVKLEELS